MGAANLATSTLVGRDQNGNLIGAVVRAGLPNLQTSMPQYYDYIDQQIADLAAYVHYLRQQRRYKELIAVKDGGDANLGRLYFNGAGNCRSCHSSESDLAGIARKYDAGSLRSHILRPGLSFIREGADAGSIAHLKALENYTSAEVQNLQA
jgi:mono/diheme cytochrome c family protein